MAICFSMCDIETRCKGVQTMFSSRTSCEIIIKDIGDGGLEMIANGDMRTYYKLNAETAGELVNANYWYQDYDNDGGIRPENN
jgi:hypothetical protein